MAILVFQWDFTRHLLYQLGWLHGKRGEVGNYSILPTPIGCLFQTVPRDRWLNIHQLLGLPTSAKDLTNRGFLHLHLLKQFLVRHQHPCLAISLPPHLRTHLRLWMVVERLRRYLLNRLGSYVTPVCRRLCQECRNILADAPSRPDGWLPWSGNSILRCCNWCISGSYRPTLTSSSCIINTQYFHWSPK